MAFSTQAVETSLNALSDQIDQCINQQFADDATPAIFAQIDLSEECPKLAGMLAVHSELTSTLSVDQDSSNLAELADLRYLAANMRNPVRDNVKLELSGLHDILDDALLDIPREQQTGWWKQLIDWLFHRDPGENDDADFRWLESFLKKLTLSASTARTILYTSTLLIAALALGLIWHEVRLGKAAGWSLFRRRSAKNTREEDLSDLENTLSINHDSLPEKLPALLNVCIDYLIKKHRLPERKSQTNHEFLTWLRTRNDAAAAPFSTLCKQAERVLYGDRRLDPDVAEQCRNEAKTLLSTVPPVESST